MPLLVLHFHRLAQGPVLQGFAPGHLEFLLAEVARETELVVFFLDGDLVH